MDSIRSMFVAGVANLVVLGAFVPAIADADEGENDHRRHGRRCSNSISHSRADYPVITNWLTSPDQPEAPSDNGNA